VLLGATKLLERRPRPVILAEVQDIRAAAWHYAAREIVTMLEDRDYTWFQISERGELLEVDTRREAFDANIVAIPNERKEDVRSQITSAARA
jgi:hypothetical protein